MAAHEDNEGYSGILANTEAKLAKALIDYIAARSNPGAPTHDMADEAIGAVNDALCDSYGFQVEQNQ